MDDAQHDVVVVGGGPAGSAIAARLARLGHDVLVLDRADFPRDKACGECVSPGAVRALARLGALDRVLDEPHSDLRGWRVAGRGGTAFMGRFRSASQGIALRRSLLDAALLEHARAAGARVRTGTRVTDVSREDGCVTGVRLADGSAVGARLVIGADGLRSVVVRRLGLLRRRPRLRKLALTAPVQDFTRANGMGELSATSWGCAGVAAVGGGLANVTLVLTDPLAIRSSSAESCFDELLSEIGGAAHAERVGPVLATGPFDWPIRSAIADGAMLIGDAAGYYDPFTGQGIYRALHGAELAAATADAALRARDTSTASLAPYERARRRAFTSGERMQRVIEAVVSRPALLEWSMARLRARPAFADLLVAVTGDISPVRALASPRLLLAGAASP